MDQDAIETCEDHERELEEVARQSEAIRAEMTRIANALKAEVGGAVLAVHDGWDGWNLVPAEPFIAISFTREQALAILGAALGTDAAGAEAFIALGGS